MVYASDLKSAVLNLERAPARRQLAEGHEVAGAWPTGCDGLSRGDSPFDIPKVGIIGLTAARSGGAISHHPGATTPKAGVGLPVPPFPNRHSFLRCPGGGSV